MLKVLAIKICFLIPLMIIYEMKKILFVSNTFFGLYNFRLGVLKTLQQKKYEIHLLAPKDNEFDKKLIDLGFITHYVKFSSKSTHPIKDFFLFLRLYFLYFKIKPHLIFHYTIKPNIYGSFAAFLNKIPNIAITTGLGYTFMRENLVGKIAKILYKIAFLFPKKVWFLNQDDQEIFIKNKLVAAEKTFILNGEGINLEVFNPINSEKKDGHLIFLLIARMLWDKGIAEFIGAASLLKNEFPTVQFQLLGPADVDNPEAISLSELKALEKKHNNIKYLGETKNVIPYINESDVIVLPSLYREGIPRVLLEAMALEKPIIASNSVGCKNTIDNGKNGFLCEPKNVKDLALQIKKMILLSTEERKQMGKAGRKKAIQEFDEKIIVHEYLKTINDVFKRK